MVGTSNKSPTKCGVFRQPREDILYESVSQCVINQDSLCKVSDFEISVHSKYNLPDLYPVDGQGRAIYWLYKHSLADREYVRTCKAGSIGDIESAKSACIPTDISVISTAMRNRKANSSQKQTRFKGRLSKLRDLFLSSTTSDIEIKETYNSYIDLTDIDTVDILLKDKENLSIDKYDNLMMNLELKKLELEKKQLENYKKMCLNDLKEKESRRDNIGKYISELINTYSRPKRKRNRKSRNGKCESRKISVMCKSTETDLLHTGLEMNNLDHILNQMKFFMQSGRINNITEAQKVQLEGYLRLLTEEAERSFSKNEFRSSSINERLRSSITESIRDIILTTELKQTSSLIVETNSSSVRYDSISLQSTNSLKKCQASSTIDIDSYTRKCQQCSTIDVDYYSKRCQECSTMDFENYSRKCQECSTMDVETFSKRCQECSTTDIECHLRKCQTSSTADFHGSRKSAQCTTLNIDNYPHSLPVNISLGEENTVSSYHSIHTDTVRNNLSEKEIKCEDLRCSGVLENAINTDSTDKLIFKQYQLDDSYDLLNFNGKEKHTKSKPNSKEMDAKQEANMDKFKSVRSFNESDTFKYLEIKQREKTFKHKAKYPPGNICLVEPDSISCSSEIDKRNNTLRRPAMKGLPPWEGNKDGNRPSTSKSEQSPSENEEIEELLHKLNREKRRLSFLKEELKYSRLKKVTASKTSLMSLKEEDESYETDKEDYHISSDSGNEDKKERQKVSFPKFKSGKDIKSNSFPKSKNVEYGKKNSQTYERISKEPKIRDRRIIEKKKKPGTNDRFSLSDNCIECQTIRPRAKIKLAKVPERKTVDLKQPLEQKKVKIEGADDCKLYLDINATDEDNVKIAAYSKKKKANEGNSKLTSVKLPSVAKNAMSRKPEDRISKKQTLRHKTKTTDFVNSVDSIKTSQVSDSQEASSASNHIVRINDSLIHLDETSIFKASEAESMESFLKNDVLSRLHKSLVPNKCETSIDCSVNIPIYKQGCEIARITRQSPSCEYTLKTYVQKMNKSTQMFEHVTKNDLYTLQWIHDNLFEININPHTLIIDEKIKEVSEMSDVSS
ncbi:hypothetical protein Trydic_g22482 [Trypoxylus dichotomus]